MTAPEVTLIHFDDKRIIPYGDLRSLTWVLDEVGFVEERIPLGQGLFLRALLALGKGVLYVGPESSFPWYPRLAPTPQEGLCRATLLDVPHTRTVTQDYNYSPDSSWWSKKKITSTQVDSYVEKTTRDYSFHPNDPEQKPYVYATVRLDVGAQSLEKTLRFGLPLGGYVTLNKTHRVLWVDVKFGNESFQYQENIKSHSNPLKVVTSHVEHSTIEGGPNALWALFLGHWVPHQVPEEGIVSAYKHKTIAPTIERLKTEAPVDWAFFRWLHAKNSYMGLKNNQLLAAFLRKVGHDYDQTLAALQKCRSTMKDRSLQWRNPITYEEDGLDPRSEACQSLPGALEKVQEIESKKDYRKAESLANQATLVGIIAERYPRLNKAVEAGNIPIGVFSQPGKDGQPVNREFALWERALGQKGWPEVIYQVAQNASGRTTYERDITPWLSALFKWPAFLDKHTQGRKKWRGIPKFVQSSWELEMANEGNDENGKQKTQKQRSAFTPWVDNDERTLTIPYVAVSVSGGRTQWCYSKHYHLFQEGFTDPESGGIVIRDFEEKLNGRDDYGLCYFTLTGTVTARGYPTFLIIFERRQRYSEPNRNGEVHTHVHFHRVRPNRSKNGVQTPACELVEACYQYMAGNVPAETVTGQQGDLIFLEHKGDPLAQKAKVADNPQSAPVMDFESHRFMSDNPEVPLSMHLSTAKSPGNRLGFLHAPAGLTVRHPEHEDIENLKEGWYEIRRCKSYENNPVGIWSMFHD